MTLLNTQEEFFVFSLIYAAHEDFEYSPAEKSYIINHFGQELESKMYALFKSKSQFEGMQIIQKSKSILLTSSDDHRKFTQMLQFLFSQDGNVSKLEKILLNFLSRF